MTESKATTKQRAAQARAAALMGEKRRERMTRIVGALAVIIVVGGIIGGAIWFSKKSGDSPAPDPKAALPTAVTAPSYAYPVTKDPKEGIPLVQIWADFQCPACKQFEQTSAPALVAEATKGSVNLELRPTIFLDQKLDNNASALATNAWGCAINAGKAVEYYTAVFAAQPAKEGPGYTQGQLLDLGKQVGLTGADYDTFASCVTGNNFKGWVANSSAQFTSGGVPGTPAIYVNGKELPNSAGVYGDPTKLIAAIMEAGK